MHDQPMCCPKCGRRTEWIGEAPQLHRCNCGFQFLLYQDDDFGFVELETGWVETSKLL